MGISYELEIIVNNGVVITFDDMWEWVVDDGLNYEGREVSFIDHTSQSYTYEGGTEIDRTDFFRDMITQKIVDRYDGEYYNLQNMQK